MLFLFFPSGHDGILGAVDGGHETGGILGAVDGGALQLTTWARPRCQPASLGSGCAGRHAFATCPAQPDDGGAGPSGGSPPQSPPHGPPRSRSRSIQRDKSKGKGRGGKGKESKGKGTKGKNVKGKKNKDGKPDKGKSAKRVRNPTPPGRRRNVGSGKLYPPRGGKAVHEREAAAAAEAAAARERDGDGADAAAEDGLDAAAGAAERRGTRSPSSDRG